MKVRICPSCGNENPEISWHCKICGTTLSIETVVDLNKKSSEKSKDNETESEKLGILPTVPLGSFEYAISLERRIGQLENQINLLRETLEKQTKQIIELDETIPNSSILSRHFLTRSLSIWGHAIAAQFIIALTFSLFFVIVSTIFSLDF